MATSARRYFGTNGVRFRPGVDRDLKFVLEFAQAIGTWFGQGRVLLGYDGRVSSPAVAHAVVAGVLSVGVDVAEAGLVPTPALQYATKALGYRGGVMITASHNPPEYNGLKVMGADGAEVTRLDEATIEEVYDGRRWRLAPWDGVGRVQPESDVLPRYFDGILRHIGVEAIRKRRFTVVVDCGNGAQGVAAPYILERLGCRVISLNAQVDGMFPGRGAEPTLETLGQLRAAVRAVGADVGVAFDGDGDRCLFCDEQGVLHWGDRSGALLVDHALRRAPGGVIVTTVSTTQIIEDVATRHEGRVVRTRVGSVDVSRAMLEHNAVFGLEENGGCFYGPHHPVRDGAMTTGLMLDALATRARPLSQLLAEIPSYHQAKTKFSCPPERREQVMNAIARHARGKVDTTDGYKLWLDAHTWILLRPSGTEPLIRVFAESDDAHRLEQVLTEFSEVVRKALPA